MIDRILNALGLGDSAFKKNLEAHMRRKYIRHPGLQAEVVVADRAYGVRDWSTGGIYFEALPDSRLTVGDKVQFMLRFRLPHETVNIVQTGRIVRSVRRGLAAEFLPLSPDTRRKFARVLDGFNAQRFLESQLA